MKKEIIDRSLSELQNDIKLTKENYDSMKSTANIFVDRARTYVKEKYKIGLSSEYLGGTKLELGVKYKDKAYDIDIALIFENADLKTLVNIKRDLVKIFRDLADSNYENADSKSKKPVIEVSFKTKDGADKFHLDFLIVGRTSSKDVFIYSETPNEYETYKELETEFIKYNDWVASALKSSKNLKPAIMALKWWNSCANQNTLKFSKLASSLLVEIATENYNGTYSIEIIRATLAKLNALLTARSYEGRFKPKWNYFRKMEDKNFREAKENVQKAIDIIDEVLQMASVEEGIALLNKVFPGLKVPKDTSVNSEAVGSKAG